MENIDIDKLCENEYDYDKNKIYEYINIRKFGKDIIEKLIAILENRNFMPNNFLNFVFKAFLDKCKKITENGSDIDGKSDENKYAVKLQVKIINLQ